MTSFLFIVSFILHIVSIVAIYTLSKQLSMNKSTDNSAEIITLMEDYLEEIRQENRILQKELSGSNEEKGEVFSTPSMKEAIQPAKEQIHAESLYNPLGNDEVQDEIEVSQQSRILKLYQEGLNADEIARKLGCGKTEVELIIKFHEKSNI